MQNNWVSNITEMKTSNLAGIKEGFTLVGPMTCHIMAFIDLNWNLSKMQERTLFHVKTWFRLNFWRDSDLELRDIKV